MAMVMNGERHQQTDKDIFSWGLYIVVTILNIMGNGDLTIRHGDPRYEFDIIAFGNFTVS
jgi:hypothetical protein